MSQHRFPPSTQPIGSGQPLGVRSDPRFRTTIGLLAAASIILAIVAGLALRRVLELERSEWRSLGKLPDWGGLWLPDRSDKAHPFGTGDPPWTPTAARQIEELKAAEKAGHPRNVYINCLPEGMPSFVIMTLNALEFLFTPGRVTILGEFDGNRLRRIYTDGRPHLVDPDLTFNGHSIGRWEGDTLVVDTVGILPQALLPVGQAVALPNNGDMHIVERIRLVGPNTPLFDLTITAPHQLADAWHLTRKFARQADRKAEIIEASCRQGDFAQARDGNGNAVFVPIAHEEGGAPLPYER